MTDLRPTILLIEDDQELAEAMIDELEGRGYSLTHAASGSEALASVKRASFDMLIADRMLPETDGLAIVTTLRADDSSTPILIISALADVDERVTGLEAGADDYLTKPFSFLEMGARVEALLRRPLHSRTTALTAGSLALDLLARTASLEGEKISLTSREFQLLEYFMARPGQLVTREMLLQKVWKYNFIPQTNVVDVHISKLRQKIDKGRQSSFIKSVRGTGFVFTADD